MTAATPPRPAFFGGHEARLPFEPEPLDALKARFRQALRTQVEDLKAVADAGGPAAMRRQIFDCEDGLRVIASAAGETAFLTVWILDGGVFDEVWRKSDAGKAVQALIARAAEIAGVEKADFGRWTPIYGEPAIALDIPLAKVSGPA